MKFKLGQKVKDVVTGFSGIVTARIEFLTGCDQYVIQPPVDEKGAVPERQQFDDVRLEYVDEGIKLPEAKKEKKETVKTGGDQQRISHNRM